MTDGEDDATRALTLAERQELRKMLRDTARVKDTFNRLREGYRDAARDLKVTIEQAKALKQDVLRFENDLLDYTLQQQTSDTIEAIALNQIQLREKIKQIVDSILANNMQKLREIRQQIDD